MTPLQNRYQQEVYIVTVIWVLLPEDPASAPSRSYRNSFLQSYPQAEAGGRGNSGKLRDLTGFKHTLSTAGTSMTSSERSSMAPLLKKEAFPALLRGREFWNALEHSNGLKYRVWGFPAVLF